MPLVHDGLRFEEAFRVDALVDDLIVCEIKSVDELAPVHEAQLLTYLRLTQKCVGFLLNFNAELMKQGMRRLTL